MMHAFQFWVNLPKHDKMIKPRYQQIASSKTPVAISGEGQVTAKVTAGGALGVQAAIETRTPIIYLRFTLKPKGKMLQPVPPQYNSFAYAAKGEEHFGKNYKLAQRGQAVIFSKDGDLISIKNSTEKKAHRLMFY
jgi:quercetin 2,3-dioxygenase